MEVRLLGPLEVLNAYGVSMRVGGPKERALLAFLAINANEVVSEDRLVDALWGDARPRTAVRTLQSHLSRLRKIFGEGDDGLMLESHPNGWCLHVDAESFDVKRADALLKVGGGKASAGDTVGAALVFSEAISLWRGRPLEEFHDQPWAVLEAGRLEEIRQLIVEERIDAELACGRHAELVGELEGICRNFPLRERPWRQRMIALYRSGRQAEALRVYQDVRRILRDELGIEPSPTLAALEHMILVHDNGLQIDPMQGRPANPFAVEGAVVPEDATTSTDPVAPATASSVVTILFSDIVRSTELLGRLGDDGFEQVLRLHFETLRTAIEASGGTEVKSLGDGVMAVFSGPHEALECAQAIQRTVSHQDRGDLGRGGIEVRVGIHAGEPVRHGSDYIGTPVVIAKRLCDAAEAGQILASQLVVDLAGNRPKSGIRELGSIPLKGIAKQIAVCSVDWADQDARPFPVALRNLAARAFVGREPELERLNGAWREAMGGTAHVVLLAGEPGIGKTSLAVRLAEEAWSQGALVFFGRCDEESVVPFQPFVEALSGYFDASPEVELRNILGAQAADLALLVPALSRRLPEVAGVAGTGAETERYRIFESVAAMFANVADSAPVVLMLDDLHWADRPTLQLLNHLVRVGDRVPLMILGTYRDTDLVRSHPMAEILADLRRANLVTRIPLRGLAAEDVVDLITAGHEATSGDRQLASALWEETEGSPLFLREILRHLDESGAIRADERGRWRAMRRLDQLGLPEGVKEVIGRRLSRLSENANTALRCGSVMGREIRIDVLDAVTDLSVDELLDALEEAGHAGVVDEVHGAFGRWSYTHALVRQALYEELSLTRRVRLHQHVAEALETLYGEVPGPHLAEVAYHFSQSAVAGTAVKAIDYGRRAADYAITIAAYEEAVRLLATVVEVAEDAHAPPDVRADLLLAQGNAEWRSGRADAARVAYDRVVALVKDDDPERLAEAALGYAGAGVRPAWVEVGVVNHRSIELLKRAVDGLPATDSRIRARAMACLAQQLHFEVAEEERRELLSADALAMARRLEDRATLAYVLVARNLAMWGPDNTHERVDNATEAMAIARAIGDMNLELSACAQRAVGYAELDATEEARAALAELKRLVELLKDPAGRTWIAGAEAGIAVGEGRFDAAEALLRESFALGHQLRDPNALPIFALGIGVVRTYQGRSEEVAGLKEGVPFYPGMRDTLRLGMATFHVESGELADAADVLAGVDPADVTALPRSALWLLAQQGLAITTFALHDAELGQKVYDLLLPFSGRVPCFLSANLGPVDFGLANAAAATGRFDQSERHFEAAQASITRNGWLAIEVRHQLSWAQMLMERGDRASKARALSLLAEVIDGGAALGMAGAVQSAKAARADLLGESADEADRPAPTVTRREKVMARLTNRARAGAAVWTKGRSDEELVRRFSANLPQRALFSGMARSYQPSMAFGFTGDLVFELLPPDDETDPSASDWWTVEVRGRKAAARRGQSDKAALTIRARLADFVRLAAGETHPIGAMIDHTVDVEGDFSLAIRLGDMFGAVTDSQPASQQA